jgi:pimeloyl-ACP methyl ester carboxylesterase
MADRLLLLVPGYQSSFQRNATLDSLKAELTEVIGHMHPAGSLTASTRGGLSGYTVSCNDKATEMYEISWQDQVVLLNQKKLLQRIVGGFFASISWLFSLGVLNAVARNRIWLMWFLLSAVLMLLWFYGIVAVALVAGGNLQIPALQLPPTISGWLSPLQLGAIHWGNLMQGWWIWVLITAALAAAGVKPDFIADMADLMQRYLSSSKSDDPSALYTLAERLRQVVYDTASALPTPGEEVLLVGHSFGSLLAVDAVAKGLPHKVTLMTLGGVLPFLLARQPGLQHTADSCATSASLTRWDDYYSREDWFGSSTPLSVQSGAYSAHSVAMGIPFILRFTLAAHHGYYNNVPILQAMIS